MRFLVALLLAFGLVGTVASVPDIVGVDQVVSAQQPTAQLDVDIDTGGDAWWTNPIWIAVGVVALIALIAIIVAASRGGTTVVKD